MHCPLHRCFQTALNRRLNARRPSPDGYLEAEIVPAEVDKAEGESERRLFLLQIGTEQEVLAPAISPEEEDMRTYGDLAEVMRENYPGTARMFSAMAEEENGHAIACSANSEKSFCI